MPDLATLEIDGRVARLTLNRPEKRNALSLDLLTALRDRVRDLSSRSADGDGPSVVVLSGEGRVFCAGMDLRAVLDDAAAPFALLSAIADLTIALRELPMVVIGKVFGAAIGGGCGLVAVCDIAITHPDAKLGYPEVDLGVCPAVVAPWLVERIGAGHARRILLAGGTLTGLEAHTVGLVSHLAPREEVEELADDIADRLAAAGPRALAATKGLLNDLERARGTHDAVRRGARISADVIAGPEAQAMLRKAYAT